MVGLLGCPNLGAWRTEENRDESDGDIEDSVHPDQTLWKPITRVTMDRAEDSQDQERAFRAKKREAIDRVCVVRLLSFYQHK